MQPAHSYIAIEGNIGAGKTTLARRLSDDLNGKLILEEFEDNSFLSGFYKDPRRYAFPLEMSFMAARFNQLKGKLLETGLFNDCMISDYSFAKSQLFAKINLDEDEYTLYMKLYGIVQPQLRQPDLLVYLHNPNEKLRWNIINRGRPYEQEIADEYLNAVHSRYMEYLRAQTQLPVLFIDCTGIDFAGNAEHYAEVRGLICREYAAGLHIAHPGGTS